MCVNEDVEVFFDGFFGMWFGVDYLSWLFWGFVGDVVNVSCGIVNVDYYCIVYSIGE